MKLLQNARLLVVFGLSGLTTTLLINCQKSDTDHADKRPVTQSPPVCSTLTHSITPNCKLESAADGSSTLQYSMVASRQNIKVKVENGAKPDINLNDALVYNGTLLPERLELGRGDELRIDFRNELTMPSDGRFNSIGTHDHSQQSPEKDLPDMQPQFTNLHTHGLVTPWDFKDSSQGRGDNVLGILFNSIKQGLPEGVKPEDICSSTGNGAAYRYPIADDHAIGLNWYHPHPHGTSGFQVEGGMSGLLMVADAKAEKRLNPIYVQLKDMQASRLQAADTYQFEKFVPAVATICHDKVSDEEWGFDGDAPGRCDYHAQNSKQAYSWLFFVNGQLFPTVKVPNAAYLRISNSSANATYRLVLEPEAVTGQPEDGKGVDYYTSPFRVMEKDGMTTVDKATTVAHQSCTLPMMTATRVGVALDFAKPGSAGFVCKLTVTKSKDGQGRITKDYNVEKVAFTQAVEEEMAKKPQAAAYHLIQEGIDTGEDDWPSVSLATLVPDANMPGADFDGYQLAVKAAKPSATHAARTDVLPPEKCDVSAVDTDNRRHVALFYGGTNFDANGDAATEHFGLVASGEDNDGVKVTAKTIDDWRKDYQSQFAHNAFDTSYQEGKKAFQEYGVPTLEETALKGLVDHKFRIEKGGFIKTNICTQIGNQAEHWRIHNLSAQIHNFHIHQMKFHVVGVRGAVCEAKADGQKVQRTSDNKPLHAYDFVDADGYLPENPEESVLKNVLDDQCSKSYADLFADLPASFTQVERLVPTGTTGTAAAPSAIAPLAVKKAVDYGMHDTFPVPPMGYIDIDVLLNKPEQVGEYVFHCHILEHEDAGMMGKVVVMPKS